MRKTFVNQENPALTFISVKEPPAEQTKESKPTPTKEATAPAEAPGGYRIVPENKSHRLQLLLTPTLYRKVKAKAEAEGQSVNKFINQLLTEAVKERNA